MSAVCSACGGLTADWPRPSCDSPINHDIWDLPTNVTPQVAPCTWRASERPSVTKKTCVPPPAESRTPADPDG